MTTTTRLYAEQSAVEEPYNFLVCGIIINDPNGPRRWAESISAYTAREAEDIARGAVWDMINEGLRGVLFVAGVFYLGNTENGQLDILAGDTYAAYADDPDRPLGVAPNYLWEPPRGFEGYE